MSSRILIWINYWNRRFAKPGGPDRAAAKPLDSKECHVANSWTCSTSRGAFRLLPQKDLHIAVCLSMGLRL